MTSSSERGATHQRFIPREELQGFAAWRPAGFGDAAASQHAAPPTEAELAERQRAAVAAARQEGYQSGYRDGLAALESFKQSFARQTSAQLGTLVASFDAEFAQLEARIAQAVATSAVALARQVVRGEIAAQPEMVARVAAEALDAVHASARQVRVRVHPEDQALVAEGAGEALATRGARLVADATLARGGCVVESDIGAVDARIEALWAQAAAQLDSAASPFIVTPDVKGSSK